MVGKKVQITTLPKKDSIKVKDDVCWICGKTFSYETYKAKRTYHHSIPTRYKPIFNILIPICQECHNKINREDMIYMRAYNSIRGIFLGFDKIVNNKINNLKKL